jgi:hypothetical protein
MVAFQQSFHHILPFGFMVLSKHGAHVFGALAVAVSLVMVWFYFYPRRVIARDEDGLQKPRRR